MNKSTLVMLSEKAAQIQDEITQTRIAIFKLSESSESFVATIQKIIEQLCMALERITAEIKAESTGVGQQLAQPKNEGEK